MPIFNSPKKATDRRGDNEIVINVERPSRQSFCDQTSQNENEHGDHDDVRGDHDVGAMVKGRDFSMTARHFAVIVLSASPSERSITVLA